MTHEYESSWTYELHLSYTVRHTPPSCRSLILYVYAQKNMANYIWKGWCKAKCNSFTHSFTWTLAIPKLLHKDKMKFTFSPFQGLSSCQNLLFFTLYLSQNSCVKFYTEEVLVTTVQSHFSIPHTFSTFIFFDILCQSCYCSLSCKNPLKIIFLCYSKGKNYCWCFYQWFGHSFMGDQFL